MVHGVWGQHLGRRRDNAPFVSGVVLLGELKQVGGAVVGLAGDHGRPKEADGEGEDDPADQGNDQHDLALLESEGKRKLK